MEARDWARILVEIRRNIVKIFALLAIAIFVSFPFTPALISLVIEEMYPKPSLSEEQIQKISEELKRSAERLKNSSEISALEELRNISKLVTPFAGPVVLTPLESLVLSIKISIAIGLGATLPYLLILASRALRTSGIIKKSAKAYAVSSLLLFIFGLVYGFFIMKFVIHFLHSITVSQGVTPLYSLSEFVNFVILMTLIFGFFFQIPIVIVFLVKNGVIKYSTIRYYRRHIYVLFFAISALVTPTVDIFTQTMLALPMILLFEIGLLFSKVLSPARS
ncbi:MAG: sec-independent protein translocase protein TatC [Archaeoglobaceae archaeon]|nr:sec-independent protein translocase protein TatC [Archaeoglobaceae archaeon]MDK2877005.1 sec-independent protein translocase protein TatC [Archaeoglobaceae archaeon]